MAETGAHSALSGAIAITVFRVMVSVSLMGQALIIAVFAFVGHLALDLVPHGHAKKMRDEIIGSVVTIFAVLLLSFSWGRWKLCFLSCVALFFGNIFDVALKIAKKKSGYKAADKITDFNLWIHWFVRSPTFCLGARQFDSHENWKGRPVFSWKYGWYNVVVLFLTIIILLLSVI